MDKNKISNTSLEGMSLEEAIEAMKLGQKITHYLFSDDEFITMNSSSVIVDESGYLLKDFWLYRTSKLWKNRWSIFQEKKVII
jgi:hypothetical protein